jgi:hypothetical protein
MFSLFFATTVLARLELLKHDPRAMSFSHHQEPELMGGPCNCNWISTPGACNTPDGSYCWTYCCKGPVPTPSPGPTPPPSPIGDWKPVELVQEYYSNELGSSKNLTRAMANGFSRQGSMRYHSQQKFNLLGGGLKFTADLSGVQNLVNANLYLVIPGTLDGGSHFYCDNSATFVSRGNACIELDIMESNGHSLVASTMHTKVGTGQGCDTWGCRGLYYFGGTINGNQAFDVSVQVSNDGNITVQLLQNGRSQYIFNNVGGFDGAAKAAIVDGMSRHGAVLMSSMWTGWVPPNTSGNGNLGGSHYSVSNIMYKGRVMGNTN